MAQGVTIIIVVEKVKPVSGHTVRSYPHTYTNKEFCYL